MAQPTPPSTRPPAPAVPAAPPAGAPNAQRGRLPLSDAELTDDEARRLAAKRANELRRARVTFCNGLAGTFIAFAILGTGTTHFLDKTHEWGTIEIATITAILIFGIALMATAWTIAANIGSED